MGLATRSLHRVPLEYSVRAMTWCFAAVQRSFWEHLRVLFSLVYLLVRCLLGLLVTVVRADVTKDVELLVLRHENAVLRRQVPRPRYEPMDRLWFAALSRLVPRRHWAMVFPVTPATILRWHRHLVARKRTYSDRRRPGRPPAAAAIKKLIMAVAEDNPSWGHRRIQGELASLGYPIAPSAVWETLNAAGIDPYRVARACL